MRPKCSPVRCTIFALKSHLHTKRKQEHLTEGIGVKPAEYPPKAKSEIFLQLQSATEGFNYAYLNVRRMLGLFIVVRSCLLSLQPKSFPCRASLILVGQVFSLWDKSCPCSPSPFLVEQVFRNLKRGGQVWAFVLSGTPHKEWARPSFGPWTWTYWARQALSHILSSSIYIFLTEG